MTISLTWSNTTGTICRHDEQNWMNEISNKCVRMCSFLYQGLHHFVCVCVCGTSLGQSEQQIYHILYVEMTPKPLVFNYKVRPTVGGAPFPDDKSCWSHARTQWVTIIADLHGSIRELLLGDWWCDRTMWKTRCSGNKCDCRTARSKLDFFFFFPTGKLFQQFFFPTSVDDVTTETTQKRLRRHWI